MNLKVALRLRQAAGRRLRFVWRNELVWELRDGDRVVAELDLERHVARCTAGAWQLESVGHGLIARPADLQNVTAAYYPRRIGMGGRIVLSEHEWFTLGRNPLTDTWRVIDHDRNEFLRLERSKPVGAGRLATPIELSLLLSTISCDDAAITPTALLAVYVVFTQPTLPTA